MVNNIDISDLMDKPYGANGRGPELYDCWGLFMEIARRLGRYVPGYDTPQNEEEKNELFETVKDLHFKRIDEPEDWCAVVFRVWDEKGKEKWHIGHVLPGCDRFIHITEKTSVCTTSLKHRHWQIFLEGFYRYG
jgi:hypothetical protein